MKRRALLASLAAGSVLGTRFALARPLAVPRRIGLFLPYDSCEPFLKAGEVGEQLPKELAKLGHDDVTLDWRCFASDYKRGAQMAAELVRRGVEIIFTQGTTPTKLVQEVTKTIPILTYVLDPVESGFTKSLSRPDGNITGFCNRHPDTPAKRIELLRRVVPKIERLALIGDAHYPDMRQLLRADEAAARAAGLVPEVKLLDRSGFDRVLSGMKGDRKQAVFIQALNDADTAEVAKLAIRYGVPTINYDRGYVEVGGLMSFMMYHENRDPREIAIFDKLLRGVKPADIPWELPDRSHLAINLSTAKLLGLTFPQDLLVSADQVVE